MEIFQTATNKELLVADILTELPSMITILESQSARHEPTLPKNWACKRKRSSSTSLSATISAANTLASMISSPFLPLSPEPIASIMPAPPLPINVENQLSNLVVSRKKRRIHVCSVVDKPETKPLPVTLAMTTHEGLKPSETEQNPIKKTRREELSENLSKLCQQRHAVAKGVEDAFRIYERLKACELQLENKEKELKLCLEREEQASVNPELIDDHWLSLSLQSFQQ